MHYGQKEEYVWTLNPVLITSGYVMLMEHLKMRGWDLRTDVAESVSVNQKIGWGVTPWQSSGYDSMLSLPRAHVRSLVEELNMPNAEWHSQKKPNVWNKRKAGIRRQEGATFPHPQEKSRLKG